MMFAVYLLLLAAFADAGQMNPPVNEQLRSAGLDAKAIAEIEADLAAHAFAKAEDRLLKQLPASTQPKDVLDVLGQIYFADAKYLQAAIAYKKSERYGSLPAASRFRLAMSYVELKRSAWARDELTRLRNADPAQPLYSYWLGRLDYDAQKFAEAEANYQKALKADGHFIRAFDGLGLCEEARGDLTAAEKDYRNATALNREQGSHLAWPSLDYGTMLAKAARFTEAEAMLREALAIDPKLEKAYYELGRVEEQTGREEQAIRDFEAASQLDPRDAPPLYALARLYRAVGKKDMADAALARFQNLKRSLSPGT